MLLMIVTRFATWVTLHANRESELQGQTIRSVRFLTLPIHFTARTHICMCVQG